MSGLKRQPFAKSGEIIPAAYKKQHLLNNLNLKLSITITINHPKKTHEILKHSKIYYLQHSFLKDHHTAYINLFLSIKKQYSTFKISHSPTCSSYI